MNEFSFGTNNIRKDITDKNYVALRISLSSPDEIRNKSNGEVKKPETINYRTHKPEPDGLFCAKIFGPVKDYTCLCGKYKKRKYEGLTCEKCGVKVTTSSVRRAWIGHIELASPVIHPWFFKTPSKIGYLLNYTTVEISKLLYEDFFAVTNPGLTKLYRDDIIREGLVLTEDQNVLITETLKDIFTNLSINDIDSALVATGSIERENLKEHLNDFYKNPDNFKILLKYFYKGENTAQYVDIDSETGKWKDVLVDFSILPKDFIDSNSIIDILFGDAYVVKDVSHPSETISYEEGKSKIPYKGVSAPAVETGDIFTKGEYNALLGDENKFEALTGLDGIKSILENFITDRGAEALRDLLKSIRLKDLSNSLRLIIKKENSETKKKKYSQRLKIVEAFFLSENKQEWMILEVIPVLPPDLRPLVPLEGGRFATSDLNDLYRRIITRNNRLKKLIEIGAPSIIVRNEKRMLQEAVDALFDNSSMAKPAKSNNGRPLKSLTESLKGKQGRFRQHLLGKRVDYSGRSVITVGPELKLHQCGLPKKMALELFKPFIFNKLIERGFVTNVKSAKKKVEDQDEIVFEILEDIVKEHPVLLNRAPTLHRLGIQAFEPILVEGKSIQLHPLVCVAFNADFDGDQMAVHLPLSIEAQIEARVLMMSTNNILSPASGKPIIGPHQDMVLGLYYITRERFFRKGEGMIFSSPEEVQIALDHKKVDIHAKVKVRIESMLDGKLETKIEDTTPGRILFWEITPKATDPDNNGKGLKFKDINKVLGKKELSKLLHKCFIEVGPKATVLFADNMKNLGFKQATKSGISVCIDNMIIPPTKKAILDKAQKEVDKTKEEVNAGTITEDEFIQKAKGIWERATKEVADEITVYMKYTNTVDKKTGKVEQEESMNPIYIMKDSGARGSDSQIKQLSGMRGLMSKPNGEIIATPIKANFRESLSVLEYFISTHGARKGLSDTALKTASSGYLTRKLVDVAHDAIVTSFDCGTIAGIEIDIDESTEIDEKEKKDEFRSRILGRISLEDISDLQGILIVAKGNEINEFVADAIIDAGVETVKIRSALTCKSRKGVCRKCYGRDLARGELVNIGEAVGVIAAQSIGEPGTQLTMRVFHHGGIASGSDLENVYKSKVDGKVVFDRISTIKDKKGVDFVVTRNGNIRIIDKNGREKEVLSVEYGSKIFVTDNQEIKKDQMLLQRDPHSKIMISEVEGIVKFVDIIQDVTYREETVQTEGITGLENTVRRILEYKGKKEYKPAISIVDEKGEVIKVRMQGDKEEFAFYPFTKDFIIQPQIKEGMKVEVGTVIATKSKKQKKNEDIVSGLPRVEELFEARKPKDIAVVSEIDGVVEFCASTKTKQKIKIKPEVGKEKLYEFPKIKEPVVKDGDFIRAGEKITEGDIDPHDILRIKGEKELSKFLVKEIQKVYKSQGVSINDKHIEVIVRQMLKKVQIMTAGDSMFLAEESIDKFRFEDEKLKLLKLKKKPATAKPLLLGISRAALQTESYISAASFQETTRVLTEAAINGKIDHLLGLKENVIMGRLIPAGTGVTNYSKLEMEILRSEEDII